ncbi:indolepyruvate ferredoxin oxidoreductase family protein [Xenorhabdus sp. DI]|uniref:indolepyruvate ferredoxin oxidoreductase family protein n=1 Tax=Xenorhabdus doucetiae TaxID=351671 RepID=UPI001992C2EA|nr:MULTISPECIES: indolepyruvate ferredoxin oxidoreductase family protein [unclassified Xenorhabdus]MBD2783211.1 indolepyruvate ferredoxin oxidoreductase family protein [Xenorhabdus sp. 3]MBD2787940.1 indolepyruvate ferredoxin oxidoreductase family protein [Xenorhabdus sp. DI]
MARYYQSKFVTGTEALVDLLLAQAELDKIHHLNTAGFVSGYRGSPLARLDQTLWQHSKQLIQANIRFQPAVNEDLAANALIGTQKVETDPDRQVSGVFSMWYGKGPGVDRSGDALKHGNAYGSSPHGGVLVIAGDDHGCVSSSMSHQSDLSMMAWSMPILHPATVADYMSVGLWGWAASRVSGAWFGFKAISEVVESGAVRESQPLPDYQIPQVDPGPDGLHWRWPDLPGPQIEKRLAYKLKAVEEFAKLNPIDYLLAPCDHPHALLVTVGKAHKDVMEALRVGGLTPAELAQHGVAFLHVRLVYPLSPLLSELATQVSHIFVIEEKAAMVEMLLAHRLVQLQKNISLIGKHNHLGQKLLPTDVELRPSRVISPLAGWLQQFDIFLSVPPEWSTAVIQHDATLPKRTPYFCAGCPHSTSTRLPDGSQAQPGIGCHVMASWMDRNTGSGLLPMGGEGVDWIGHSPFVNRSHVFQNLGDGTYFHSGHLAIRQSVAAGSHITYKLLFNDAVAMTGGQPLDGNITLPQIVSLMQAEGVKEVVVVTDDLDKYKDKNNLPANVKLYERDYLEDVQKRLRDIVGVTVLIYDQACATELRRKRKRGLVPKVTRRAVINEWVCEGCGDCQIQSNCLAVIPAKTPLGTKRQIDQHVCNSDLSCLKGFCPSFITVENATPRADLSKLIPHDELDKIIHQLPQPTRVSAETPYEILLVGIGGTGIVTAGHLLSNAAQLDNCFVNLLNFTGFAQKGGEAITHVRLCHNQDKLHQVRIDRGRANLVIAADLVAATGQSSLEVMSKGSTKCLLSTHETQIGTMLRSPMLDLDHPKMLDTLHQHTQTLLSIDAEMMAAHLVGDRNQTNIILIGYAWQLGKLPITLSSLHNAIQELGASADNARRAFWIGRIAAVQPDILQKRLNMTPQAKIKSLDDLIMHRYQFLVDYQNERYAMRYLSRIAQVQMVAQQIDAEEITRSIAENLFKLMAYKDEYEVARLYVKTGFFDKLRAQFDNTDTLRFHLSVPLFNRKDPRTGQRGKREYGSWIIPVFRLLAACKPLRGTVFDIFGYQDERKQERNLLLEYERLIDFLIEKMDRTNLATCQQLAELPNQVRGFGHVKQKAIERMLESKAELLKAL